MKDLFYKAVRAVLLLAGSIVITFLSVRAPVDGLEISGSIGCGFPSGLPFAFIGTWKYHPEGFPIPLCAVGYDSAALILDISFWLVALYLISYFIKNVIMRKSIKIISRISILILFFSVWSISAQAAVKFDLENLRNQNFQLTRAYDRIDVQKAWDAVLNSDIQLATTTVGIVDTGIDPDHHEFNLPEVNLGSFNRLLLFDSELNGHGTQVAGIIGANNISRIVPLPTDSPQMNGILSGILEENQYTLEIRPFTIPLLATSTLINVSSALEKAITRNSQVINMSFGLSPCSALSVIDLDRLKKRCFKTDQEFLDDFDTYEQIFQQATSTLFVASAGNNNIDAALSLPAALGLLDNVITVGATDLDDQRAIAIPLLQESNFGSVVGVSAPGINVYSPKPGNEYKETFGGTSASAPMVTGVAGLLKAIDFTLTPSEIKQVLVATGDAITTDKPIGPRLNALNAVARVLPPTIDSVDPPSAKRGETLDVVITGKNFFENIMTGDFGPDITVNSIFVTSSTTLTLNITISQTAALGTRDVSLTKSPPGGGTATLPSAFTVEALLPTLAPWPQFQHDARHRGQSPFVGPQTNTIKWSFVPAIVPPVGGFVNTPVVGPDDIIYIGAGTQSQGRLFALHPDGSLKWQSALLPAAPTNPAVITDGMIIIIVGTEDSGTDIIAFDDNGNTLWTFPVGNRVDFVTVSQDGTVYATSEDGFLFSLTPTQTQAIENWRVQLGRRTLVGSSPTVGQDGTIYVVDRQPSPRNSPLFAINPTNGSIIWTNFLPSGTASSALLLTDDTVVVATPSSLQGFNPTDGRTVFTVSYPFGSPTIPILLPDGTIAVGVRESGGNGTLHRINPVTQSIVSTVSLGPFFTLGTPVTDIQGTIYITANPVNPTPNQATLFAISGNTVLFTRTFTFIIGHLALASIPTLYLPVLDSGQLQLMAVGE